MKYLCINSRRLMFLILLILVLSFVTESSYAQTKIMPIGDSITQSNSTHNSYRRDLWFLLSGHSVDFVGSKKNNYGGAPPNNDFDRDHEGHWGWRADEIDAEITAWAQSAQPDIALIHLGTNDVFQNQSISSTITEIEQIIAKLRAVNPNISILLAQVIPADRKLTELQNLNAQIASNFPPLSTAQSPIVIVDQYTGFDYNTDTFDGVHPDASGELKMAQKWYNALVNDLSLPVSLSGFSANYSNSSVNLTWETQSEVNNVGFEIYRKPANVDSFNLLASYLTNEALRGRLNASTLTKYNYSDYSVSENEIYDYKLADVDLNGKKTFHPTLRINTEIQLIEAFRLLSNYPNPFNPETTITFQMAFAERVFDTPELQIFDVSGKIVRSYSLKNYSAGLNRVVWDGKNESGQPASSGVYFAVINAGEKKQALKMMLQR